MFAVIALTMLMSSVLIGLNFANRLVAPIRRLMGAANLVSTGDLHVQVPVLKSEGDLAQLGETFNKMTSELRTQRDELVSAQRPHRQPAPLHRGGAVVGAAPASSASTAPARIGILNRSAEKLIGHSEVRDAADIRCPRSCPNSKRSDADAREKGRNGWCRARSRSTATDSERNLSVRVSAEQSGRPRDSYIITLDDITELVSAQRTSAWADVARRIAHEIKNPLTPIQLSAERIRRKYGKVDHRGSSRSSSNAPTRSCVRSTTSSAWSMSSHASRACRSP